MSNSPYIAKEISKDAMQRDLISIRDVNAYGELKVNYWLNKARSEQWSTEVVQELTKLAAKEKDTAFEILLIAKKIMES